jgi:hypothetical protein
MDCVTFWLREESVAGPKESYQNTLLNFFGQNNVRNSSTLPVPKTNTLKQYNTKVRVVSFYTTQGLG